jgi:tungstate transport system substrate-binding protein
VARRRRDCRRDPRVDARLGAAIHHRGLHHVDRAVGLFKQLLPEATKALGFEVRVVAVGTGQALDMGRRGDADVEFVHDKVAEEKFLAEGFGVKRYEVMYNDFIIVGPKSDPAGAKGKDVVEALKKIAAAQAPFASRADKSGTHAAELRYWKAAGIDPPRARGIAKPARAWAPRSTPPRA